MHYQYIETKMRTQWIKQLVDYIIFLSLIKYLYFLYYIIYKFYFQFIFIIILFYNNFIFVIFILLL